MHRFILFLSFFILISSAVFTQKGWRKGEMEIRVNAGTPEQKHRIQSLGLEIESASQDGHSFRAYIIPDELRKLDSAGVHYTVTIANLNDYYHHFWEDQLVPSGYYTYEQIVDIADSLAANFPSICKKVIYGTSVGARQLAALKISDNVDTDENEPEIMFDGGIHGDEVGGSQNLIMYARDLCKGYGTDPTYTSLINTREIWLYYMVNPDGRVNMSRYNDNGVDCNRDAGYMWNGEGNSLGAFSQPESKALRNCLLDHRFVVYTNYHSGSEVVAYPWSYRSSAAPDNTNFNQMAYYYSNSSGYPYLPYGQGYNIMYPINGSFKDVQYGCFGQVGWSIEISNDKQPIASLIPTYYNYNVPAMNSVIKHAGWGVEGVLTDSISGKPIQGIVWVGNFYPAYNNPTPGDYHKYVFPASYTIKVTANGFKPKSVTNVLVPDSMSVVTNFQLAPDTGFYAFRVISCQIPNNNFSDPGYTPGILGAPDNTAYAIGRNGWIVADMGDTIVNKTGNDIKIYEAGSMNRSYTCWVSSSMDGIWKSLGTGTGTASFDLAIASVSKARYVKIVDDGDGPSTGVGIGFNLDAIQMLHPPLTADFTASSTNICHGSTIDYSDNSEGNPIIWFWHFPGGTPDTSSLQSPTGIIYNTPGNYDVTLTISNGLSTVSKTKTSYISVFELPSQPSTPYGPIVASSGDSSVYTTDPMQGVTSYNWSLSPASAGMVTGTGNLSTVYWSGSFEGSAWIKVAGTNVCGTGIFSDSLEVIVSKPNGISIPGKKKALLVYPNPSGGKFWYIFSGTSEYIIRITDPLGRQILFKKSKEGSFSGIIDLTGYPSGIYMLQLVSGKTCIKEKFVIQ